MTITPNISLAPEALMSQHVEASIFHVLDGCFGLGMRTAHYETIMRQTSTADTTSSGWDQSTFFDHDLADCLLAEALFAAKNYATANNLFFNSIKLRDHISQRCIEEYSRGFLVILPK